MGTISGMGFYPFGKAGRLYGLLIGVHGRAYVVGASRRGIFWRFGARIFCPVDGYFESIFGVRTRFGLVDLMLKVGMRDEVLPVVFRPNWVHGALHLKRSGGISFVLTAMDSDRFPKLERKNYEVFSTGELGDSVFYDDSYQE